MLIHSVIFSLIRSFALTISFFLAVTFHSFEMTHSHRVDLNLASFGDDKAQSFDPGCRWELETDKKVDETDPSVLEFQITQQMIWIMFTSYKILRLMQQILFG